MRLSEEELRALVRLQLDADFNTFLEVLGREGESITKALILNEQLDSGQLYQLRGKAQAYVSIVDAITKARSTLDNIETHREKP